MTNNNNKESLPLLTCPFCMTEFSNVELLQICIQSHIINQNTKMVAFRIVEILLSKEKQTLEIIDARISFLTNEIKETHPMGNEDFLLELYAKKEELKLLKSCLEK